MQERDIVSVPYIVHEGSIARMERVTKRLIWTILVLIFLLFFSNCAWLYAWMQYDYSSEANTETVTVDGKDGVANYIGNDGDITNGESGSKESENGQNESKGGH